MGGRGGGGKEEVSKIQISSKACALMTITHKFPEGDVWTALLQNVTKDEIKMGYFKI